ncbi:MAG: dTMP kinase [Acidobacteriota bacterium]|nr:dTMP kinase [Acidobacteriota bacterium]MDW3229605.1 dTMP kinase [Acidobacteriota bacterium]
MMKKSNKRSSRAGLFIVLEGIDGSGKSTQAKLLARKLRSKGLEVLTLSEPTDGKWGQEIRQLSRVKDSLKPQGELDLFVWDRKENVAKNIKPALKSGKTVVLDRYFYSTLAYQGARGVPLKKIRELHKKFAPTPDVVFILDLPVTNGLKRIKDRAVIYRHFEDKDYLKKVRQVFLELKDPECVVIDGRPSAREIHRKIWAVLTGRFPNLK